LGHKANEQDLFRSRLRAAHRTTADVQEKTCSNERTDCENQFHRNLRIEFIFAPPAGQCTQLVLKAQLVPTLAPESPKFKHLGLTGTIGLTGLSTLLYQYTTYDLRFEQ